MSEGTIKLMRCPIDTHCGDCNKHLAFGVWVYYNPETSEAVCPKCAVKKGWTPKQRVKQLIKSLELREDLKTLKKFKEIKLRELMGLRQRINIHKLGERELDLEKKILVLIDTVKDYLHHAGTPKEEQALNKVLQVMRQTQKLQKEVREEVQNRLYLIERREAKEKKKRQKVLARGG